MSDCPGENALRLLGSDALDESTYILIEEHIKDCTDCKSLLESLARQGTPSPIVLPGPRRPPQIVGFEIQHELGRGSMGVVYLATQTGLGRPVALKILPSAVGIDALTTARRRWLREARAVASLRHPNIVPLFDYGEEDGWFFLVLEYIPGGSLKKRLEGPLPPLVAVRLVETIARAVNAIHRSGLLHLDLKSSNILLDCEGDVEWDRVIPRVADFGLSLFEDIDANETNLSGPRGTPSYMAPEQVVGSRELLGPTTDIYAVGAILYELLTGRPPFQAPSTIETLDQVRGQDPVPPRRLNPAIPRDLETICLKCLRKDPAKRYPSAEAMANDLRRSLDGLPIVARPTSSVEKGWKWCLRRPAVAALAASLVLSLSAGFLGVLLLWRYAEGERNRAEADYVVSRAALANILDLTEKSIEPNLVHTRESVIGLLNAARTQILELANRRPEDPATWRLMGDVDLFLGRNFEYQGQWIDGESFYVEALKNWEDFLAQTPGELGVLYRRWQTLECLGRVLELEGKVTDSATYWKRAVAAGESLLPKMASPDFNTMTSCRLGFARLLSQQGDHERAAQILIANLEMLASFLPKGKTTELLLKLRETSVSLLSIGEQSDSASAQVWSQRMLDSLRVSSDLSPAPSYELLESGYLFQQSLTEKASIQRRNGEREKARRTVERMRAFADILVARHPDRSVPHLIMTMVYSQYAKEGWESKDRSAVKRYWNLALEEARRAMALDPQETRAHVELKNYECRLNKLMASEQAVQNQAHALAR